MASPPGLSAGARAGRGTLERCRPRIRL